MPILTIHTNVAKSDIPATFVKEATESLAEGIRRAKEVNDLNVKLFISMCCWKFLIYISTVQEIWICIVPDMVMAIGGDDAPCARCELMSIGSLGEKENVTISKAICDVISSKLSIKYDR